MEKLFEPQWACSVCFFPPHDLARVVTQNSSASSKQRLGNLDKREEMGS